MINLDRTVCPTGLSDDSERTIRYAVAIAIRENTYVV
jgi:hypothetical protein